MSECLNCAAERDAARAEAAKWKQRAGEEEADKLWSVGESKRALDEARGHIAALREALGPFARTTMMSQPECEKARAALAAPAPRGVWLTEQYCTEIIQDSHVDHNLNALPVLRRETFEYIKAHFEVSKT